MLLVNSVSTHIKDYSTKSLSVFRRQFLKDKEFTIISNNCWAGWVYRRYGLYYQSPTIGLYMFAQDYIEFCEYYEKYLDSSLKFIKAGDSKYCNALLERKQQNVPIGILADRIEIVFLHYRDENEAYEKWNRRVDRINNNNLIFKFSEMDLCSKEHIAEFAKLPYRKKICFTANQYPQYQCCIPVSKVLKNGRVADDTSYYADYIDLTKFINDGVIQLKNAVQEHA